MKQTTNLKVKTQHNIARSNLIDPKHFSILFQELVGTKKKRPYKKYFLISLIFLIVIGIIVVVVVYVTKQPSNDEPTPDPVQSAIALEDILDNRLYARKNNATWISKTELLYRNQNVSTDK